MVRAVAGEPVLRLRRRIGSERGRAKRRDHQQGEQARTERGRTVPSPHGSQDGHVRRSRAWPGGRVWRWSDGVRAGHASSAPPIAGSRWASGALGRHGRAADAGHGHRPPANGSAPGALGAEVASVPAGARSHHPRRWRSDRECAYPRAGSIEPGSASPACRSRSSAGGRVRVSGRVGWLLVTLLTLVLVACGGPGTPAGPTGSIDPAGSPLASLDPDDIAVCEAMLVMEDGLHRVQAVKLRAGARHRLDQALQSVLTGQDALLQNATLADAHARCGPWASPSPTWSSRSRTSGRPSIIDVAAEQREARQQPAAQGHRHLPALGGLRRPGDADRAARRESRVRASCPTTRRGHQSRADRSSVRFVPQPAARLVRPWCVRAGERPERGTMVGMPQVRQLVHHHGVQHERAAPAGVAS